MHINKLTYTQKNSRLHYYSFSRLWHGEVLFKTIVVTSLIVINIILLVYASTQLDRSKYVDIPTLFRWMSLLLYCGFLIDIESSRVLKVCLSILILINFVCIERDILIVGITVEFLNLGVLLSIFGHEEMNLDSKYSYEDEYILPLIDSNRKLLNAYYELWRRNNYEGVKIYSGLLVTRCIIMSCMHLCILLINTIDKYTNFDKNKFIDVKSVIYLRSTKVIQNNEYIGGILQMNGKNSIVAIQIIIITLTVLFKPFLIKLVKLIRIVSNKAFAPLVEDKMTEEVSRIADLSTGDIDSRQNLDAGLNATESVVNNRNEFINSCIFFSSAFLFGILTYNNPEFDIISRMFLIREDQTILLCILLPLVGLLTEISMFRDWCWYFLFSWVIYYFNLLSDDSVAKSITILLSGALFNTSAILFACSQINDVSQYNTAKKYTLTNYIFHKMCYFLGFNAAKIIFSIQKSNMFISTSLIITNLIIIYNLYFLLYVCPAQEIISKQDDHEVEWDVEY